MKYAVVLLLFAAVAVHGRSLLGPARQLSSQPEEEKKLPGIIKLPRDFILRAIRRRLWLLEKAVDGLGKLAETVVGVGDNVRGRIESVVSNARKAVENLRNKVESDIKNGRADLRTLVEEVGNLARNIIGDAQDAIRKILEGDKATTTKAPAVTPEATTAEPSADVEPSDQ